MIDWHGASQVSYSRDVYLETRKSMEVKNQGGLRISVKEVEVTQLLALDRNGSEPSFRCRWRVAGWIGHWGHVHARANEHEALIAISPRDGSWKITKIEMLDQQHRSNDRQTRSHSNRLREHD